MVSPRDILDKVLNTEVTGVTAREMVGVSRDLSTALADLIRVRTVTSANANAQAHHVQGCLTHGSLLEIPVTIGETTYTAVVDSGSEVNIIRSDMYQNDVRIPIVSEVDMLLCDTNGGNNRLLGLVPDLEMKVGTLRTWSSVWVSETCLPAILLGHPWQCENMVSTDERSTGTYLRLSEGSKGH
jgi:hypothetical protein